MYMKKVMAALVITGLVGCGSDPGEAPQPEDVGEVASLLGADQVADMNAAARGTSIRYVLATPQNPNAPDKLTVHFRPNEELRRVSRHHFRGEFLADRLPAMPVPLPR